MGLAKSKSPSIIFPEAILAQLRCSLCRSYLSCGPIRLLPDGSSVCGRCSPSVDGAPIYRELALELALSKAVFPCRFKQYGCMHQLPFGQAINHETKCLYKPFACPSLPFTSCTWHGSSAQICCHFMEVHPTLTTLLGQFALDIDQDKHQVLMVVKDFVAFMIKYRYDGTTTMLHHDIRFFAPYELEASYKIKLFNCQNPDLNINLKSNKCFAFTPEISEMQVLDVHKFLDVLENPGTVKVEVNISMRKYPLKLVKAHNLINNELIETLRCEDCHCYLALPIFDSPKGIICSDCAENYTNCVPSANEDLCRLIAETNYPCRWHDCKFMGKGYYMRRHELSCRYYPYDCPAPSCTSVLTLARVKYMAFHLMLLHGYEFFIRRISYESTFRFNSDKTMVTVMNNEIMLIKHRMSGSNTHIFSLQCFKPGLKKILTAKIHFEHWHCKLKSKTFILDNKMNLNVTADKLPKCFGGNEKMTVVIEV